MGPSAKIAICFSRSLRSSYYCQSSEYQVPPSTLAWECRAPNSGYLDLTQNPKSLIVSKRAFLEGHWDLVSRVIMGIIGVTIWVIGVINLLTKSP